MPLTRKVRWGFFVLLALFLLSPFIVSLFLPWSPINCWHYDVDIHSGRIRYTRYYAFIRIRQEITGSTLSAVLQPQDYLDSQPDWRRAMTFSPGVKNSPHYIFHSAINQMKQLNLAWQSGHFTPAAQKTSAIHVLQLWNKGQSDDAAKTYLQTVGEIAFGKDAVVHGIDVNDLPKN